MAYNTYVEYLASKVYIHHDDPLYSITNMCILSFTCGHEFILSV